MNNQEKTDFVPLTPEGVQILREMEIRRAGFLDGILAAHGLRGGEWELATDGSGFTRKASPKPSPS